MLFAIICTDKPGQFETRSATRPDHLAFLKTYVDRIQFAGPMMGPDGKPSGSIVMLEAADKAEAEGFAAADPYAKVGLFESVIIRPLRTVFRDGKLAE
ncbi:YciI family protein [Acetobacter sicerae]|uniref:YciI family protein n=1 Tax=Acetobacter sicerae TaxID=85325 RepID=A0ABS8VTT1_9PROT|nr:YciI family protein [Acetobacter sicerae]MCE0742974.1 YciI family protein [Acetobacter sicerae]NHN91361.1 YciI family protein [Acetobacter sicerae]